MKQERTVCIYIAAKRVALEGVSCIHYRPTYIFLLLACSFAEEGLIILKALKRRSNPQVNCILEWIYRPFMQVHFLSSSTIPFLKHMIVCLFLFKAHFDQHSHLFCLHFSLRTYFSPWRKSFIKCFWRLDWRMKYFCLSFVLEVALNLFHVWNQFLLILFIHFLWWAR